MSNPPGLRPICGLCVVEDYSKCPEGFTVIRYTNDNKTDADLWRDTGYYIFGKRKMRFLAYSRGSEQEEPSFVVEAVAVMAEGDIPPAGYTAIQVTKDTGQRALKKKLLCYRLAQYNQCVQAVYEVALLATKRLPDGFMPAGDIDGIQICFKLGPGRAGFNGGALPYSLSTSGPRVYPALNGNGTPMDTGAPDGGYPNGNGNGGNVTPTRRAPAPPPRPDAEYENFGHVRSDSTCGQEIAHYGLEGVTFDMSNELKMMNGSRSVVLPEIKVFTDDMWNRDEFKYEFRTETDVMSAGFFTIRR